MLTGAHALIYSSNPEADRAFFRDLLKLSNVDAGNLFRKAWVHRWSAPR